MGHDVAAVRTFLDDLGHPPTRLHPLTGGAWSSAFAFDSGSRPLILRLDGASQDYEADAFIAGLGLAGVPVPAVLAHGRARDGSLAGTTFAVSERVPGVPLEDVSPGVWSALLPQLADVLESLRQTAPPESHPVPQWRDHLLQVGTYPWHDGWREHVQPAAARLFDYGLDRLREVCPATVPVSLVHADWINRNVHVHEGRISGVFDWGCYRFGDHLYDLAWFEFWSPWHRNLDVAALTATLCRRWQAAGINPVADPDRRLACLLHIGLDHIVYNTLHGTAAGLDGTMKRLGQFL